MGTDGFTVKPAKIASKKHSPRNSRLLRLKNCYTECKGVSCSIVTNFKSHSDAAQDLPQKAELTIEAR